MADIAKQLQTDTDWYPSRIDLKPHLTGRQDPIVYGTARSGPLSVSQLAAYAEHGFFSFKHLFSAEELAPYTNELERLRASQAITRMPESVIEPESEDVRTIFAIHEHNAILQELCHHPRVVGIARQLLGSEVYIHKSRINYKPGFKGKEFYWHSDFETWHVEDGMPGMRAVSCAISLTDNHEFNGPLMVIPGSHKQFLSCAGVTPEYNYRQSLKRQEYGIPDNQSIIKMVDKGGITAPKGPIGSVMFFECNLMHGSNSNISPFPRSNMFMVFNSIENTLMEPFSGQAPRPPHIANRHDFSPIDYQPE